MAKTHITLDLIKEFSKQQDLESVAGVFCACTQLLEEAIDKVSAKNVILIPRQNVFLDVYGPFQYGSNTMSSDIDILISVQSPQLQLNSQRMIKSRFELLKQRFVDAWNNNKSKRKKKKKLRKQKKKQELNLLKNRAEKPYDLSDFKDDLADEIVKLLPSTCIIYNNINDIRVVAQRELGANFNIKIAIKSDVATKLYDYNHNTFIKYDFDYVSQNIKKQIELHGNNFIKLFRILNSLYYSLYRKQPPIFLVESLLLKMAQTEIFSGKNETKLYLTFINYVNLITPYKLIYSSDIYQYVSDKKMAAALANHIKEFLIKLIKMAEKF